MRTPIVQVLALILLGLGCNADPTVTGSDDVFVLPGAQITLDVFGIVDNGLLARGTLRNGGTTRYTPYWYVEGDFYADSTYSLKLGGAVRSFSFALDPGESTVLDLRFTSTVVDVNLYPNFRVKNLRAYRNKD